MQNVNFFAYFLTLYQGSAREKLAKTLILQMVYATLFGLILGILNSFNIVVFMIGFAAFFSSIPMQWARTVKPNLTSLVPLSQRRKTVYNLLSIPAMFITSLLIMGAICFTIWLLSGLFAAAIVGDSAMIFDILKLYTEGFGNSFADGYAALLFISVLLFIMGAGMIYSHTDGKKYRNITALTTFGVALVGTECILQTAMRYSGSSSSVHVAGFAGMYIKFLPVPWLAVLLSAIIALASLGCGIYLVIRKNKPKNY